jgi:hypothetical protein
MSPRKNLADFIPAAPAESPVLPEHPAPDKRASKPAIISASQNDGGKAASKAGEPASRPPRRVGRPRGPNRVALTVRILQATDDRLTAAVETTGRSPQYIVDEALARYLDSLGL